MGIKLYPLADIWFYYVNSLINNAVVSTMRFYEIEYLSMYMGIYEVFEFVQFVTVYYSDCSIWRVK